MNVDAINNLAGFLENIPSRHNRGFNMESYAGTVGEYTEANVGFQCKSTACIAGWACMILGQKGQVLKNARRESQIEGAYEEVAGNLLGLGYRMADELFEPMNNSCTALEVNWSKVTPRQAAKVLRHLAKAGEVDWEVAFA
ncbi:hypothetical protein [Mesorhizobium sp. WSM2239]|uniref:Uncharacterized protein n=2 Tax=unclassified Mesorhizobium TaxID=325217 RepID=A0AAU8DGN7_9HYPH